MGALGEYRRKTWVGTDISPEQTEHATARRVPFVVTFAPRWEYLCPVVVEPDGVFPGVAPTDAEVTAIGSFVEEYGSRVYRPSFRDVMAGFAPYDIDGGANVGILRKGPDGCWWYRKKTWTYGPRWVSGLNETGSLLAVLDRINSDGGETVSESWSAWKRDHPDVFGPLAQEVR